MPVGILRRQSPSSRVPDTARGAGRYPTDALSENSTGEIREALFNQ
ncbi:hypothetical protein [Prevotella dentasini]|nr:hypothetical protein [Prevotella dentasini]